MNHQLDNESRIWLVGGVWFTAAASIVGYSVAAGASVTSSVLLFALCAAPLGVAALIGLGAPSPTVAELLYAVNTQKEGRG